MAKAERHQLLRGVAGCLVALRVPEAGDLGPHLRSIRDVVVRQRVGPRVSTELGVALEEVRPRLGVPEPFEVHREERHVVQSVPESQSIVELEAVEQSRAVVEAEDVLGQQVAVSVECSAIAYPLVEQRAPPAEIVTDQRGHPFEIAPLQRAAGELAELLEPLIPQCAYCIVARSGIDLEAAGRVAVHLDNETCELAQLLANTGQLQAHAEATIVRQPLHHHHVVDHHALATDVVHTEVHVRREPAIQVDLTVAREFTGLASGEVEEPRSYGLLHLERHVSNHEQGGHMGLDDARRTELRHGPSIAARRPAAVEHQAEFDVTNGPNLPRRSDSLDRWPMLEQNVPMTIKVFLLDDHEIVRRGVRELLENEDDIEVVGEAGTVAQALDRAALVTPDVALLDVQLPDGSGVSVCRDLRSERPELKCLMLTSFSDDEALVEAVMAGASGYLLKQVRGSNIVDAVRRVAAGESLLDPNLTSRVIERIRRGPEEDERLKHLTAQEHRILDLLAVGKTNRQIASELFLAEKTVKNYVSNLLAKMGMSRRTEAAVYAARLEERRQTI